MSKCRYDLSKDCSNTDCLNCVLDKIRAEIVHLHDWAFDREEILRIIDKYRAESEGGTQHMQEVDDGK